MSPLLLHFASGDSLYSGQLLLLVSLAFSARARSRRARFAGDAAALAGVLFTVLATPPLPAIGYVAFLICAGAWLVLVHRPALHRAAAIAALLTAALGLAAMVVELPRTFFRAPPPGDYRSLDVVGDSLSAGLTGTENAWPAAFSRAFGIPVENHSRVAAKVGDIVPALGTEAFDHRLVLVEIGGNDELFGTPTSAFARDLRALLVRLHDPTNALVMFELPLLPTRRELGRIQRDLAQELHVALIPKRYLAGVLAPMAATSDGLHLTTVGIAHMVATVHRLLGPSLLSHVADRPPSK
jgi:hypothetical protein